jgi:hypothetical protein
VRPSSNSRAPTAAANLGREHQTALGSGGRHPGSTAENAAAGRGNPGAHSPGVCGMCPQPPLAAAAARRPAQALATAAIRANCNKKHHSLDMPTTSLLAAWKGGVCACLVWIASARLIPATAWASGGLHFNGVKGSNLKQTRGDWAVSMTANMEKLGP